MVRVPEVRRGLCFCTCAALLFFALKASPAAGTASKPAQQPAQRIPVESFGFVPQSRFFMLYRVPWVTLDFLDTTHLLFTFHVASLMHREPDDPEDDQDQTIRALVLTVPAGKVLAEGTWRLHDRGRYLWALGDGDFVLRQRDHLLISDRSLVLKDYLQAAGTLASVQVSPDGSTLVAQYARAAHSSEDEEGDGRPAGAPSLGDDAPRLPSHRRQFSLLVVDTRDRKAERIAELPHAVQLPMVQGGYLGVQQTSSKGNAWDVSLASFHGNAHFVATVHSTCQPAIEPLSKTAFLTESCLPYSDNRLIDAFDIDGHKLWEQTWQSRFAWGTLAYSVAGNRFAYGSIEMNHTVTEAAPVDDTSILGEPVGVFNLQSGKLDIVLDATPILTAGENFALSPDGDKLAILRDGAIEIYDLPPLGPPVAAAAARHP
jgi:hypothetical protein